MKLRYHPLVQRDVSEIIGFYDEAGGAKLGDAFFAELEAPVAAICARPTRYPHVDQIRRRANLRRFPYHVLYRTVGETVRVLIVRHHRRHPKFGLARR